MNIIVAGCGKVGKHLSEELSRRGHYVSVVDSDERHLEDLGADFDGFRTLGSPIDQDVLKKAGIESCDAVCAMTQDDNINIMVSQLAATFYEVKTVLTRIYNPEREEVFSHFGLKTVCPTNLIVETVCNTIEHEGKSVSLSFENHSANFVTEEVTKEQDGFYPYQIKLGEREAPFAVIRKDGSIELVSAKSKPLRRGDRLIIAHLVD